MHYKMMDKNQKYFIFENIYIYIYKTVILMRHQTDYHFAHKYENC